MVSVAWASTARTSHYSAPRPEPTALGLALLFAEWSAADDKQQFMAALDLPTAQALTSFILARVPRGTPTKYARRRERS